MASIRVSDEVKRRLERRKRGDESFEAVIERLVADETEERRRRIANGFGAWDGTDSARIAREMRAAAKRDQREHWDTADENGREESEDDAETEVEGGGPQ